MTASLRRRARRGAAYAGSGQPTGSRAEASMTRTRGAGAEGERADIAAGSDGSSAPARRPSAIAAATLVTTAAITAT